MLSITARLFKCMLEQNFDIFKTLLSFFKFEPSNLGFWSIKILDFSKFTHLFFYIISYYFSTYVNEQRRHNSSIFFLFFSKLGRNFPYDKTWNECEYGHKMPMFTPIPGLVIRKAITTDYIHMRIMTQIWLGHFLALLVPYTSLYVKLTKNSRTSDDTFSQCLIMVMGHWFSQ